MTPRATDWGLALLVGLLFGTGVISLFSGRSSDGWVFALHGIGGFALGGVLVWKARRVWRRLLRPRDRRTAAGTGAAALVALALFSGWAWSSGLQLSLAGYNLLNWHFALGTALTLVVLGHALLRAKPLRPADLAGRRQFLRLGAVAVGSYAAWWLQRPVEELLELRGAQRRFTGSYERSSFSGNDFPTTSWVADQPRELDARAWRLDVGGLVERRLRLSFDDLDTGDELVATLDCTGGFYSRQRWRGIALERLLAQARPLEPASHLRVISHTGYRWGFELGELDDLLLATHVGGERLSHGHGAPLRLVARDRRGFQWVKWVVRIELDDGPDRGAAASTVWSSFTDEGRGAA